VTGGRGEGGGIVDRLYLLSEVFNGNAWTFLAEYPRRPIKMVPSRVAPGHTGASRFLSRSLLLPGRKRERERERERGGREGGVGESRAVILNPRNGAAFKYFAPAADCDARQCSRSQRDPFLSLSLSLSLSVSMQIVKCEPDVGLQSIEARKL